jgi:hypothetical protein
MKTPDWIIQGFDSKADWEKKQGIKSKKKKGKTFKVRECPKCKSRDVGVVIGGGEGKGSDGWQCNKCKWKGHDIKEKELTEDEFMKYLDESGEEVA